MLRLHSKHHQDLTVLLCSRARIGFPCGDRAGGDRARSGEDQDEGERQYLREGPYHWPTP